MYVRHLSGLAKKLVLRHFILLPGDVNDDDANVVLFPRIKDLFSLRVWG